MKVRYTAGEIYIMYQLVQVIEVYFTKLDGAYKPPMGF